MKEVYDIPKNFSNANITPELYKNMYQESIEDPETFWAEQAKSLSWIKDFDKVKDSDFTKPHIEWFKGGKLNACYNCVDRHLEKNKDKVALLWEADDPNEASRHITYQELYQQVNRLSSVLKNNGVKKGDKVIIYMPMVPELAFSCLACARIGAVHSVVFGGFSAESLLTRIKDCQAKIVITADGGFRGKKVIDLKEICDQALEKSDVKQCLVLKRTGAKIDMKEGRDMWWHEEMAKPEVVDYIKPEIMDSEDPLFILYTSGSTGKPKGVLHTTAGYLLYASISHLYVFDYKPEDIFWCTADIGWVTGHTWVVYGPLANAATSLMFEGVPNYPDFGRFWDVVDKHKVSIFHTAPTAIRAIAGAGDELVLKHSLDSLRLIGTVGEPINPEAWAWYHKTVGKGRCPIVDTYWQTETGAVLIAPLPGAIKNKPGSASLPFFGVQLQLLDPTSGKVIEGEGSGVLAIKDSWPGITRTIYGDHDRFFKTYFSQYPGYYFTGDGCKRDKDGYYWITGRVDDVINVSGHRLGTAEIESALVLHKKVAEAAVIGMPHPIKGQGLYAFVTLNASEKPSEELQKELNGLLRKEIGPIASLDAMQWTPSLPKTRSGKIMRRILRKIVEKDEANIGDISTLADTSVVEEILKNRVI
ncbi:MAG: acetate--CoA ligase [SAR324 cluster bacterium]|nr:acetate--CoA ligase [SAR324 cluster bacterium]